MESYFHIRYNFNHESVRNDIARLLREGKTGYVCVADGNILSMVHRDPAYRETVNKAFFSLCDSSWVPLFLKQLYGISRSPYCGADIFRDLLTENNGYRMCFLGSDAEPLQKLRHSLSQKKAALAEADYIPLPFAAVEDFDYASIAAQLRSAKPDIIWVSLGAPKQELFMERLQEHLEHGIMIGVGAVFNFFSGRVKRAPRWMRCCRLEFVYRILQEPSKQLQRCRLILHDLPALYLEERRQKQKNT